MAKKGTSPSKKAQASEAVNANKRKSAERLIAKKLFVEDGYTSAEIGEWLGVSQHSLSKWKKEDHWEQGRVEYGSRPETIERQVMKNLESLNKEFGDSITNKEYGRQATIGDLIAKQNKLLLTVRKDGKPTQLHMIRTLEDIMQWLRTRDADLLKRFTPLAREFVQIQSNE